MTFDDQQLAALRLRVTELRANTYDVLVMEALLARLDAAEAVANVLSDPHYNVLSWVQRACDLVKTWRKVQGRWRGGD